MTSQVRSATALTVESQTSARNQNHHSAIDELRLTNEGGTATATMGLSAIDTGFEVTSLEDNLVADGELTLREAIRNANAAPDANTITFADDIAGGTIELTEGQLDITSSLSIEGRGATIDQKTDELSGENKHRVLKIDGNSQSSKVVVNLDALSISGGDTKEDGGGIHLREADLHLANCSIEENRAFNGGGAHLNGQVSLDHTSVSRNSTIFEDKFGPPSPYGGSGGGILNLGTLSIADSNIEQNSTVSDGGGLFNSGRLNIQNSDVSRNSSFDIFNSAYLYGGRGAGLFTDSDATIENSRFDRNFSLKAGGGIFNGGDLILENIAMSKNGVETFFSEEGGAVANYGSAQIRNSYFRENEANIGGALSNRGHAEVFNSDFSRNSASITYSPLDSQGGGAVANFSSLTIDQSNIANNGSGYRGGGIYNFGSAVINNSVLYSNFAFGFGGGLENNGSVLIRETIISGNNASYYGGGISNHGFARIEQTTLHENIGSYNGGAIYNESRIEVSESTLDMNNSYKGGGIINRGQAAVSNSIVANSQGGDIIDEGELSLSGINLIEDGSVNGANVISADPLLGPLQDNGGVTPTLALLPGSPAIDAGDPAFGTTTDQRGFARDVAPDIGAFEVQTASPDDDLSYIPVTAVPDAAVLGTDEDNRLDGTQSAEYFNARAGRDDQIGDGGNDIFLMGPGRDFIGGGGGNDTALFDGLIDDFDGLIFDGDLTYFITDTNPADGDSGRDRLGGVETFEFKDAVFDATNGDITPKTDGTLSYVPVVDIPSREGFGTDDDNRLVGSKAAEYFDAGGGSDTDIGEGGDDVFLMGPGRDFIGGGGGNDTAIFDGLIEDFAGLIFDGDLTYFITDTNPADGDSGRDRLGGVETFEFKDAVFDATNGDITFKSGGAAALNLTALVNELDLPVS